MKAEDVMKALEHCANYKSSEVSCIGCPIYGRCFDEPNLIEISALALLREKDAEVERLTRICDSYALQYGTAVDKEVLLKQERADTVRKTIDAARKQAFVAGDNQYISIAELEEIVKDTLEGG